jgi:predicted small metal-binding protein
MFELKCRDVGFDCGGVVTGPTREDVLKQAAAHASTVHQTTITPEMAVQVAGLIRERPTPTDAA